jgi:hypothetical protein
MNKNKLTIVIDRSSKDVFEFTVNPKNTPLWISHIQEEAADAYPPKIGTIYKNRGASDSWDNYIVVELDKNKIFTLKASDNNYHVRYTYRKVSATSMELEYYEWVNQGELSNPFTRKTLNKLKEVMEE